MKRNQQEIIFSVLLNSGKDLSRMHTALNKQVPIDQIESFCKNRTERTIRLLKQHGVVLDEENESVLLFDLIYLHWTLEKNAFSSNVSSEILSYVQLVRNSDNPGNISLILKRIRENVEKLADISQNDPVRSEGFSRVISLMVSQKLGKTRMIRNEEADCEEELLCCGEVVSSREISPEKTIQIDQHPHVLLQKQLEQMNTIQQPSQSQQQQQQQQAQSQEDVNGGTQRQTGGKPEAETIELTVVPGNPELAAFVIRNTGSLDVKIKLQFKASKMISNLVKFLTNKFASAFKDRPGKLRLTPPTISTTAKWEIEDSRVTFNSIREVLDPFRKEKRYHLWWHWLPDGEPWQSSMDAHDIDPTASRLYDERVNSGAYDLIDPVSNSDYLGPETPAPQQPHQSQQQQQHQHQQQQHHHAQHHHQHQGQHHHQHQQQSHQKQQQQELDAAGTGSKKANVLSGGFVFGSTGLSSPPFGSTKHIIGGGITTSIHSAPQSTEHGFALQNSPLSGRPQLSVSSSNLAVFGQSKQPMSAGPVNILTPRSVSGRTSHPSLHLASLASDSPALSPMLPSSQSAPHSLHQPQLHQQLQQLQNQQQQQQNQQQNQQQQQPRASVDENMSPLVQSSPGHGGAAAQQKVRKQPQKRQPREKKLSAAQGQHPHSQQPVRPHQPKPHSHAGEAHHSNMLFESSLGAPKQRDPAHIEGRMTSIIGSGGAAAGLQAQGHQSPAQSIYLDKPAINVGSGFGSHFAVGSLSLADVKQAKQRQQFFFESNMLSSLQPMPSSDSAGGFGMPPHAQQMGADDPKDGAGVKKRKSGRPLGSSNKVKRDKSNNCNVGTMGNGPTELGGNAPLGNALHAHDDSDVHEHDEMQHHQHHQHLVDSHSQMLPPASMAPSSLTGNLGLSHHHLHTHLHNQFSLPMFDDRSMDRFEYNETIGKVQRVTPDLSPPVITTPSPQADLAGSAPTPSSIPASAAALANQQQQQQHQQHQQHQQQRMEQQQHQRMEQQRMEQHHQMQQFQQATSGPRFVQTSASNTGMHPPAGHGHVPRPSAIAHSTPQHPSHSNSSGLFTKIHLAGSDESLMDLFAHEHPSNPGPSNIAAGFSENSNGAGEWRSMLDFNSNSNLNQNYG